MYTYILIYVDFPNKTSNRNVHQFVHAQACKYLRLACVIVLEHAHTCTL